MISILIGAHWRRTDHITPSPFGLGKLVIYPPKIETFGENRTVLAKKWRFLSKNSRKRAKFAIRANFMLHRKVLGMATKKGRQNLHPLTGRSDLAHQWAYSNYLILTFSRKTDFQPPSNLFSTLLQGYGVIKFNKNIAGTTNSEFCKNNSKVRFN